MLWCAARDKRDRADVRLDVARCDVLLAIHMAFRLHILQRYSEVTQLLCALLECPSRFVASLLHPGVYYVKEIMELLASRGVMSEKKFVALLN